MSDSKIAVSIIVPIYNVSKYLNQCLDSILAQTLNSIEIILIDDGSTDESPQICDDYASRDSRITVVHKKNEGLFAARKTGAALAQGRYVGFVDGDDYIADTMYEMLYDEAKRNICDVVNCRLIPSFDSGETGAAFPLKYIGNYSGDKMLGLLLQNWYMDSTPESDASIPPSLSSKIIRTDRIKQAYISAGNGVTVGEDMIISYPIILKSASVSFIDEGLYFYRQRKDSTIKSYWRNYPNNLKSQMSLLNMTDCPSRAEAAWKKFLSRYSQRMMLEAMYNEWDNPDKSAYSTDYLVSFFHDDFWNYAWESKEKNIVNGNTRKMALFCLKYRMTFLLQIYEYLYKRKRGLNAA